MTEPSGGIMQILKGCLSVSRFWRTAIQMALTTALSLVAPIGHATSPAAIVEEVSGEQIGLAPFDLLLTGERFSLPSQAKIVVGYFASCVVEQIEGGHVTIGINSSIVDDGIVIRATLPCPVALTKEQLPPTAHLPVLFRPHRGETARRPAVLLQYTSPVITLRQPGEVIIERLDREETTRLFVVESPVIDLAKHAVYLTPGGLYRVRAGDRELVFQVAHDANQGGGPLLPRLLRP